MPPYADAAGCWGNVHMCLSTPGMSASIQELRQLKNFPFSCLRLLLLPFFVKLPLLTSISLSLSIHGIISTLSESCGSSLFLTDFHADHRSPIGLLRNHTHLRPGSLQVSFPRITNTRESKRTGIQTGQAHSSNARARQCV
jgi:hypothetical protein